MHRLLKQGFEKVLPPEDQRSCSILKMQGITVVAPCKESL